MVCYSQAEYGVKGRVGRGEGGEWEHTMKDRQYIRRYNGNKE